MPPLARSTAHGASPAVAAPPRSRGPARRPAVAPRRRVENGREAVPWPAAAASGAAAAGAPATGAPAADVKARLRAVLAGTHRGGTTTKATRGDVEEAVLALEALSPADADFDAFLAGRWRLAFTTAVDVAPLLAAGAAVEAVPWLPVPRVGAIYQEFDPPAVGGVRNVIRFGAPPLLAADGGVTATVAARYEVRSGRRLRLRFERAGLGRVRLSGLGEALVAPALLTSRGSLQHKALLALRELDVGVPLRNALPTPLRAWGERLEQQAGSEYLITFLDGDTLVGRQTGPGGLFVFWREPEAGGEDGAGE